MLIPNVCVGGRGVLQGRSIVIVSANLNIERSFKGTELPVVVCWLVQLKLGDRGALNLWICLTAPPPPTRWVHPPARGCVNGYVSARMSNPKARGGKSRQFKCVVTAVNLLLSRGWCRIMSSTWLIKHKDHTDSSPDLHTASTVVELLPHKTQHAFHISAQPFIVKNDFFFFLHFCCSFYF